jgi:hypothetical protein
VQLSESSDSESEESEEIKPKKKQAPAKKQPAAKKGGLFEGKSKVAKKKDGPTECKYCEEAHEDGFQCDKNTRHVECNSCKEAIPFREELF